MRTLALLVSVALGGAAFAQAPAELSVDGKQSTLTFHLVHKFHRIDGVSHKIEGKARLADGKAQVGLRVPTESFDSGNVNRDAHMKEAVEAAKYPYVELRALAEGVTAPATFPATVEKTFKVQLNFHGVQKQFDQPVKLVWESTDKVRALATLVISLDAYKVERPSLMFVKVDDELKIDATIKFEK